MTPASTPFLDKSRMAPRSVRRVAVIGAECTGKTSLCQTLSQWLPGIAFTEPLRLWVEEKGTPPGREQQRALLTMQQQAEAKAVQQAHTLGRSWVLCDSAPLLTAVYSEIYYDDQGLYELALAHHAQSYQATLVCNADLPWEADPGQRDGPALRDTTHALLLQRLEDHGLGYFVVRGQGPERARLAQDFLSGVDFAHR